MKSKFFTKEAILGGIEYQKANKIAWNTYQYIDKEGNRKIRYTFTDILTIKPDGEMVLNSGGWQTQTTKKHINEFLPPKLRIKQRKGVWFIGKTLFFDGMRLKSGKVLPALDKEQEARQEARRTIATTLFNKLSRNFDQIEQEHVKDLCQEAFQVKEQLNLILGLNEANQFRQELVFNMSGEEFNKDYPATFELLKTVANGKAFSVAENTIDIENNQKMRFTRYLAREQNRLNELKDGIGQKVCEELNIKSLGEIANFRDKIKPKKCVISTNPLDFITASENSSYSSCYSFGGAYFNSTIALCRSPQAAIIYVYDDDQNRKIGRSWAYLFPEAKKFIMLKSYGSFYEGERKIVREFIEEKLSQHFQIQNLWKKQVFEHYSNYEGHGDPVYFDSGNVTFVRHITADQEQEHIDLPKALCLACGGNTSNAQGATCEDCESPKYHCCSCESLLDEDDVYSYNGDDYCEECFHDNYFYCDCCGDDHSNEQEHYVESEGRSYCDYCFSRYFHHCTQCDEVLNQNKGNYYTSDDGEVYCEDCYHELFVRCEHCDSETERKDATEINNEYYCPDCVEELFVQCADCDDWIEIDDAKILGEKSYCEFCYETELYNTLESLIPEAFNTIPLLPERTGLDPIINISLLPEQNPQYKAERILELQAA